MPQDAGTICSVLDVSLAARWKGEMLALVGAKHLLPVRKRKLEKEEAGRLLPKLVRNYPARTRENEQSMR